MTDSPPVVSGDRRRNAFPSMTETEYQLFLATVREQVTAGVKNGMTTYRLDNCEGHVKSTENLKTAVFGRRAHGVGAGAQGRLQGRRHAHVAVGRDRRVRTYRIGASSEPEIIEDNAYIIHHRTTFVLALVRWPS